MRKSILAVGMLLSGAALAQPTQPAGPEAPPPSDHLAARSLHASALAMLYAPPRTPGRAGRLVALTQFADRLTPGDASINRLLANVIYRSRNESELAARAARVYLDTFGDDHAEWLLWLRMSMATLNRAEDRREFLKSVLEDTGAPNPLRAEAAVRLAGIYLGQGRRDEARKVLSERARALDPCHRTAWEVGLRLKEDPTPLDRARALLGLLRGDPCDAGTLAELAMLLDSLGLHAEARGIFEDARAAAGKRGLPLAHRLFLAPYVNAMLSTGAAEEVVRKYLSVARALPEGVDLRPLMVEACRATGRKQEADAIIEQMQREYDRKTTNSYTSPEFATELAWFYLQVRPPPKKALVYARLAHRARPDDPAVRLVLGAAELKADQHADGEKRLEELLKDDPYAAAFLAEHYYAIDKPAKAAETILAGASLERNGPGFRMLAKLAGTHDLTIPPAAFSGETSQELARARDYLAVGREPEKHVEMTLRGVLQRIAPGEPIEVEVALTNRSGVDLPLGEQGLVNPAASLHVTVAGRREPFTNLPLVVLPAPRLLKPKQTVSKRIRIDVGELAAYLAARCLDELTVTVTALPDPVQRDDGRVVSRLPAVKIAPVEIVRADLLGRFDRTDAAAWADAYRLRLAYIVRDFQTGDLPARMRAARQTGALLTAVRMIELGKVSPPRQLIGSMTKPVILSMTNALLKSSSPVVRAETLAAMQTVPLDASILKLPALGAAADDTSPLVRLRLAELVGTSGTADRNTLLEYLRRDSDPVVRLMARAFEKPGE